MAVDASSISSADASAIIDSALLDASQGEEGVIAPPGNATLLPTTGGNQPAPETQPLSAEDQQIHDAKVDLLGKEQADALEKEAAEKAAHEATLLGTAEKYLNAGKSKASDVSVSIGNIPTPGRLGTPLALLCIFFFILVSYGGNSRLQWIWKVLTNNAYIGAGTSNTPTVFTTPSVTGSTGTGGITTGNGTLPGETGPVAPTFPGPTSLPVNTGTGGLGVPTPGNGTLPAQYGHNGIYGGNPYS